MTRTRRFVRLVAPLFAVVMMLTGCPKKPAPTGGTSPGGGAALSASGPPGGGPPGAGVGTAPGGTGGSSASGGAGAPAGGAGSRGSATAGGTPVTGTTIPAVPSPKEFVDTSALKDIHFDFDRYDIRSRDAKVLEENARWLKANASALVLIEGHADERGTNEYNLALGERRAKATRDYLVSLGVSRSRISIIPYGEERPVCTAHTEDCWAQNRRGHFLVRLGAP